MTSLVNTMVCSSHITTIGQDGNAWFCSDQSGTNLYNCCMEANGFIL